MAKNANGREKERRHEKVLAVTIASTIINDPIRFSRLWQESSEKKREREGIVWCGYAAAER